MLDVLGSIASLLGLAFNVREELGGATREGVCLKTLSILADFGESWKGVHHDYHALMPSVSPLVEMLTTHDRGQRQPARATSIAPDHLRWVVFSGNLNSAIITFRNVTKKSIRGIEAMKTASDPAWQQNLETLRREGLKPVADNLVEIADDRSIVVGIHAEFLEFLDRLYKFSAAPDWDETHVRFFIDSRPLLDTKYHEVIRRTDNVIMQMLDSFDLIIRDFYK